MLLQAYNTPLSATEPASSFDGWSIVHTEQENTRIKSDEAKKALDHNDKLLSTHSDAACEVDASRNSLTPAEDHSKPGSAVSTKLSNTSIPCQSQAERLRNNLCQSRLQVDIEREKLSTLYRLTTATLEDIQNFLPLDNLSESGCRPADFEYGRLKGQFTEDVKILVEQCRATREAEPKLKELEARIARHGVWLVGIPNLATTVPGTEGDASEESDDGLDPSNIERSSIHSLRDSIGRVGVLRERIEDLELQRRHALVNVAAMETEGKMAMPSDRAFLGSFQLRRQALDTELEQALHSLELSKKERQDPSPPAKHAALSGAISHNGSIPTNSAAGNFDHWLEDVSV